MKLKYLFSISIFTISCEAQYNNLYIFNPTALVENKISLAEIADDINYIALDNSLPIGLIYHYEFIKNSIFLSAKDIGILSFNREGKIQNKIGSRGRGPGEYTYFMNFAINEKNESLYLIDHNTIKVYSKNGNYIRTIPLQETGGFFLQIEFFNSKLFLPQYIMAGKAKYNWIVMDTLGNLITMKKNCIPDFQSPFLAQGGTFSSENRICYWNCYNDTVFSIFPDLSYKASFLLSSGNYRLPRSRFDSGKEPYDYLLLGSILETNHFLTIGYFYKQSTIALIEKKSKKSFVTYLEEGTWRGGISNNLDGGIDFQPDNYFQENGQEYLSGIINPLELKTYVASSKFKNSVPKYPDKKKKLEKLANNIKETDNPIFMIIRLKK